MLEKSLGIEKIRDLSTLPHPIKFLYHCEMIERVLVPKVCRGIQDLPLEA